MAQITITLSTALVQALRDIGITQAQVANHVVADLKRLVTHRRLAEFTAQLNEELEQEKRNTLSTETETEQQRLEGLLV